MLWLSVLKAVLLLSDMVCNRYGVETSETDPQRFRIIRHFNARNETVWYVEKL